MSLKITRAHGTGGKSAQDLIRQSFLPYLKNDLLSPHDAAEVPWGSPQIFVTTDSTVVDPLVFPGGNAGKLSITGGINDLLTRGARAQYASIGFVLSEELPLEDLSVNLKSLSHELTSHNLKIICADTKVIASSNQPTLIINTTLIGSPINPAFQLNGIKEGDSLVVSGALGAHGLAILQARQKLPFKTVFESDCASLHSLLEPEILKGTPISYMRDVTRGGLAGILHELARQFEVSFRLNESTLPIESAVRSGLSILGIDPLEVANEGVMLIAIPEEHADSLVERLRQHRLGKFAARVGSTIKSTRSPLVMRTEIGGERIIPWPEALNLPRIC